MSENEEVIWSTSGPATWWRGVARGTFPPRRTVVMQHSTDGERWVDCAGETAAIAWAHSVEADLAAAREAQREAERERDALLEALQWSSGAPSFLPGGEAREGWLKLCAPLLGLTAAPTVEPAEGPGGEVGCHADDDGECDWSGCPQLRDGEPKASGRHCPLDVCRECGEVNPGKRHERRGGP